MARRLVRRIVDCDRMAGFGSQPKPPKTLMGKRVTLWRPLIAYYAHSVKYNGKIYVLLNCEIDKCRHYDAKKLNHMNVIDIAGSCGSMCPLVSKTKVTEAKGE